MALAALVVLFSLFSAAPASAAPLRPASCLIAPKGGSAPKTLDELRACQSSAREDLIDAAEAKGKPLTAEQLDKIDDLQRAEARRFLARTQIVTTGPPVPAAASSDASKGKLGGVTPADLGRVDAKTGSSIAGLQDRLHAAAGDGKDGITPAMADDIRATLTQSQGSISPDMQKLLDAVQKDGGKLTPDTMKLLQGAGRAAKSEGLDLNIDPGTEKDILNHDFESDKPAFNSQQPPASN